MTRFITAVVALLSLAPAFASAAPGDPPFTLVAVSTRVARLGHQHEIEAYYRTLRQAEVALKIEGLDEIYALASGGRAHTFRSFRVVKEWHELDTNAAERNLETLTRVFGADEATRLSLALAAASESVVDEVLQVSPGVNNWHVSPSGRPWPYMQVRRSVVKPGMVPEYTAFVAKMRDVRVAAQAAPELRWSIVEGQGNVFGTTRYFRGWQDRALWEDEMLVVLGETEAATWLARFQASIVSTETFVLRHRADLSRRPVEPTSEQQ